MLHASADRTDGVARTLQRRISAIALGNIELRAESATLGNVS
jgi:hypothetical protein